MLRTTAAEGTDIAAAENPAEGTDIAAAENPAEGTDIAAAENHAEMAADEVLKMEPLLIIAAAGIKKDISAAARIDPALFEA